MATGIPWSVKGIEPEAREAAKDAARRAGLTLGAWLNRAILEQGTGQSGGGMAEGPEETQGSGQGGPARGEGRDTQSLRDLSHRYARGRPLSGLGFSRSRRFETQDPDLAEAVDELAHRLDASDRRTSELIGSIEGALNAIADRLMDRERHASPRNSERAAPKIDQIEQRMIRLAERLERVEEAAAPPDPTVETLKSVERAILDVGKSLQDTGTRTGKAIHEIEDSLRGVAERVSHVEQRHNEAFQKVEQSIARINQRVERADSSRHQGLKAIEGAIHDLAQFIRNAQDSATDSIASIRENVSRLTETVETVREDASQAVRADDLSRIETRLDERIASATETVLRRSREEARATAEAAEARSADAIQEVEARLTALAQDVETLKENSGSEALKSLSTRMDEGFAKMGESLTDVASRLDKSEERNKEHLKTVDAAIKAMAERIEKVERRVPQAPAPPPPFPGSATAAEAGGASQPASSPPPPPPPDQWRAVMPPPFPEMPAAHQGAATPPPYPHPQSFQEPEAPHADYPAPGEDGNPPRRHEGYIAAARRAAQAAAEQAAMDQRGRGFGFAGFGSGHAVAAGNGSTGLRRMLTIAGIATLVAIGLVALLMLWTGESTPPDRPARAAAQQEATTNGVVTPPNDTQLVPVPEAEAGVPDHDTALRDTAPAANGGRQEAGANNATRTAPTRRESAPAPTPAREQQMAARTPPSEPVRTETRQPSPPTGSAARRLYEQGVARLDAGEISQGVTLLREAAGMGFAPAQYRLAVLYQNGRGVPQDAEAAERWYTAAARGGNRKAMHNLAVMYAEGGGVDQDFARAAEWFGEAAALGLTDSQFNLAVLLERGMGVRENLADAFRWYAIAARLGDDEAASRRDAVAGRLPREQRERILAEAERWRPQPMDPLANALFADGGTAAAQGTGSSLVMEAQQLLDQLGYDPGPADGIVGPQTAEAVRRFERSLGLAETGQVDEALVDRLQAFVR